MKRKVLAVALTAMMSSFATAPAKPYSSRAITMICPFPPGGLLDTLGRVWASPLCVAIDVVAAFPCLAVCPQAVVHPAQQIANNGRANLVARLLRLWLVDNSTRMGSPRVVGTTRPLRSRNSVGASATSSRMSQRP
jgi:hypothetical protein